LVKPVLVLLLFGERDRLGWDRTARKKILTFGRWIMLSSALFFLSSQSDRLIFGKLVSADTFAEYSVALSLAMIASEVVGRMVGGVFFPYLCRVEAPALRATMLRLRAPLLAVAAYALSGLGGGANSVVALLYKPEYAGASTSLMLLAPGVFIACGLDSSLSTALKAVGQPRWVAFGAFGKLVGMVALIPLGYSLGGFAGGVAGCSAAELIRYAITLVGARRHGIFVPKQDLLWTLGLLVVGTLTWLVDQTLTENGVRVWPRSLLIFAFTTACWAPVLWHLRRSLRVRSGG
jgi:O-antigen/teichoic acid export membrane protein